MRPGLALRLALAGLRRAPGPTALAIGTLALGMTAPATFFSLLVGAIRPLPVPDGDRVVRVDVFQSSAAEALYVLPADLPSLQGVATLEALGAFRTFRAVLRDADRAATRVSAAVLTPEVLPTLRVRPYLGRIPGPGDPRSGLLLADELWRELYGRDPSALGRSVTLDGDALTVVGVMPEGFGFPFRQNAWVVHEPRPEDDRSVELVGRLAPGATLESATEELRARWGAGDTYRDPSRAGARLEVRPFTGGRGEAGEAVAFLGLVVVGLGLLVIACANVANLLLVRATERVRALGIQAALGASRDQIAAQLLLESALIATAGGLLGLMMTAGALQVVQRALAAEHFGYFWMRMGLDGRVLTFTGVLVAGAAVAAGLLPVVRVLRIDLRGVLSEVGGGAPVVGGGSWSHAFVLAQLALSCGALVAVGLTGGALAESRDFGRGVPADEILVASLHPPRGFTAGRLDELTAALQGVQGVSAVGVSRGAPGYLEPASPLEVEGQTYDRPEDRDFTLWNEVTPGFFAALDLPLRVGRALAPEDRSEPVQVAVVNESFARRFSPDRDVLGLRIRLLAADSTRWVTVVGVVADADLGGGDRLREDRAYLPLAAPPRDDLLLLTRADRDGASVAPGVRRVVAAADPGLALSQVRTLADAHVFMTRVPRALSSMALAGGASGLVVATVGLYGLLAFRVRQRRQELGVRLALGADGPRLAREILGSALRLLLPATALGLTLAWLLSPVLSAMLLGLDPRSPELYAAVAVGFVLTGLVAAALPATRASRVHPARALRP